jgi:hypothetical protein
MNDSITNVVNAFTERKVRFDVRIKGRGFRQWLRDKNLVRGARTFVLKPLSLGTMARVSEMLLKINTDAFKTEEPLAAAHTLIANDARKQAYIIALAITNSPEAPGKNLVDFFLHNLTARELDALVKHVVESMDVESFINSIVSIRGINILETNPKTGKSQVAPHGPMSEA